MSEELEIITTFVCDSCGHRFDKSLKQTYTDEAMESWELCPACMIH